MVLQKCIMVEDGAVLKTKLVNPIKTNTAVKRQKPCVLIASKIMYFVFTIS